MSSDESIDAFYTLPSGYWEAAGFEAGGETLSRLGDLADSLHGSGSLRVRDESEFRGAHVMMATMFRGRFEVATEALRDSLSAYLRERGFEPPVDVVGRGGDSDDHDDGGDGDEDDDSKEEEEDDDDDDDDSEEEDEFEVAVDVVGRGGDCSDNDGDDGEEEEEYDDSKEDDDDDDVSNDDDSKEEEEEEDGKDEEEEEEDGEEDNKDEEEEEEEAGEEEEGGDGRDEWRRQDFLMVGSLYWSTRN